MATLIDIAKKTCRSVSTVSVVLRGEAGKFGICKETEKQIRQAAAELGYVKNETARTMASGKSRVLGFISGGRRTVEYSGRLLLGALESASSLQYSLRVFYSCPDTRETLIPTLQAQQIRGVLISGDLGTESAAWIIEECSKYGIHCVTANLSNPREGFGVVSDDAGGMEAMVCRLHENGHRKIALLSSLASVQYSKKRLSGYRAGMRKCGLPPKVFLSDGADLPMLVGQGFTAVMCESDYIAAVLMQQAYAAEIRVPEIISVCGFAGMQVADFAALPLTTVAQDFEGMGEKAAQLLIAMLEKGIVPQGGRVRNFSLPTSIRIQKSTKGI